MKVEVNNIVAISDIHCGCQLGLCPPEGVKLDEGGTYKPSAFQRKVWKMWRIFWDKFVPDAVRGEPFAVVMCGDSIDGTHHNSTHQITHNLTDQARIAYGVLEPVVELCKGRYYHIRGTEAHVGKSSQEEEALAEDLGAIPTKEGQFARYELWKRCGPRLVQFMHHIGTTGSQAYEATGVHKELTEAFIEAARWGEEPPDCIVRGHRHRYIETNIATKNGYASAAVCPGWQGKTPFVWKISGARLSLPQFGGLLIRHAHDRLFIDPKVFSVKRGKPE